MLTQIYTFIHTYLIECRTKEEFVGKNHQLATIDPKIESNSRRIKQGGKTNDFLTLLFTLLALQFITFAFFLFISIIFIPFFFLPFHFYTHLLFRTFSRFSRFTSTQIVSFINHLSRIFFIHIFISIYGVALHSTHMVNAHTSFWVPIFACTLSHLMMLLYEIYQPYRQYFALLWFFFVF